MTHIARFAVPEWPGYLCVLLAATCWAIAGAVAKYLMLQGIPTLILTEMRVTVAAALLLLLLAVKKPALLRIKLRDLRYMAILGVAGVAGVHYTYYSAISKTNVATAILLQYLAPAFILLFAVLMGNERFSSAKAGSMGLAFAGCFFMVGGHDLQLFEANKAGLLMGLTSAGFFAFYSLYGEYGLKKYSIWTMLLYAFTAAALFWWCFHPPWKIFAAHYSLRIWGFFVFLGIFSAILPFGLYFVGIRYIQATRASITAMFEPVTAGLIAYLFLGETMSGLQLMGGGLVLAGILWLQIAREPGH